jgi:hypothetical protein
MGEHLLHIAANIWRRCKVWPSTCEPCTVYFAPDKKQGQHGELRVGEQKDGER